MFELLDYSYSSVGQFVNFAKADTIIDEMGQEYSNDTLIISVDVNAAEADIINLFKSNELEIIYKMDNLKMYTVKLKNPMTADDLDAYIAELEKNENILAVNKNYIMQLDEPVQMPNPFIPYKNIDAAKKALSFNPSVPSYIPAGYEIDEITVMENNFLQIIYKNDKDESICYRTAVGNEDISGDYNIYVNTKTIKVGDLEVMARGNENISVAVWNAGNLTHSIQSDKELSEKEIKDIIMSL